jgi:NAD(P)-dependent dehydrogenase (short-subunit alcohol dehydrogenase family)
MRRGGSSRVNQDLAGRRILITGASRGIGRVVAKRLARQGADIVAVARDRPALESLRSELGPGRHAVIPLDVRDHAAWVAARGLIAPDGKLAGVVTAAAVVTPIGPIGSWGIEEFRETLDVNVVGTLAAITSTIDYLMAAGNASVVAFSGGGATGPLPRFDAYAASKAAVVRLAENLAHELEPHQVRVNSVAPGFVVTDIHNATLEAGPELVGAGYYDRTAQAMAAGEGDSPDLAAELVAFLVSDASVGITGKLISARWDPWHDPEFRERLRDSDFATLRRIDDQFFTALDGPSR